MYHKFFEQANRKSGVQSVVEENPGRVRNFPRRYMFLLGSPFSNSGIGEKQGALPGVTAPGYGRASSELFIGAINNSYR